jgi:hypothetical protein
MSRRNWVGARVAVVVAFAVLTLVLALHHAPWRDEADPWLVARDCSVPEILRLMSYVGSPALWYLVLVPFAKLGLPYVTMHLVNWAFAVSAVALLVMASPLPLALTASFSFSYLLSYEYAVIARSYMASVLLIFALAALHHRRRDRPLTYAMLLVLLFNTNAHGFIIGGVVWALAAFETLQERPRRHRAVAGVALGFGGACAALAQVIPRADGQMMAALPSWAPHPEVAVLAIGGAFFPGWSGVMGTVGGVAVLLFVAVSLLRDRQAFITLVGSVTGLLLLFVLIYPGAVRHWGFMAVAAVFAIWTVREENRSGTNSTLGVTRPAGPQVRWGAAFSLHHLRRQLGSVGTAALVISFGFSDVTAWRTWNDERTTDFSGSRAMAAYIIVHGYGRAPIAAHPAEMASAVLPYLPARKFWYPGIRAWGSHMWWDRAMMEGRNISEDELFDRVEHEFAGRDDVLVLSNRPLSSARKHGFDLLHAVTANRVGDESFFLYRRTPTRLQRSEHSGKN